MFPTLSDIFEYLFGIKISIQIQTFGLFVALAFVSAYFVFKSEFKRKEKEGCIKPFHRKGIYTHPYELMDTLILWCACCGFIGAKLFSFFEDFGTFMKDPWAQITSFSGLTFYGGLIFGALIYLYIGRKYGMKLIHLADIGSPGMLVAYGVGRIGCHLSGDGDWGLVNMAKKPALLSWLPDWMWSFNFPHNAINEGDIIPNCIGQHCMVLPYPVYPTSFYEVVMIAIIFIVLWGFRKKMRPGMMFALYLIAIGTERLLIERIRINIKMHWLGISFTEAELISAMMLLGGLVLLAVLLLKKKASHI